MYVQCKCHRYVYVLVITHIHCDRPAEKIWDAVDNFRFLRKSLSGDRVNQTGMNGRGTVSFLYAKANDDLDHTDSQISSHVLFTKHNTANHHSCSANAHVLPSADRETVMHVFAPSIKRAVESDSLKGI